MLKKLMLFLGVFLMVSASAYAAEQYSLSGEVMFSGQENIYVSIYTIEDFPHYKNSFPSERFFQTIKPNPEQIKAGRFSFTFSGIPKGSYCVIAFQDLDNNGKLTCDTWGAIEEPVCYYKEWTKLVTANWNHVKFELDKDISGIMMKLD